MTRLRHRWAVSDEQARDLAAAEGVCVRPILSKVTDTVTGQSRTVAIPCGATREGVCPSCAHRARRLRIQQCREGWHLADEPEPPTPNGDDDEDRPDLDVEERDQGGRRVRSTRRRQDAPGLPRLPVEDRTVGRAFETPDGKRFRPSMFLTLTLPSYGPVTAEGVPVDPAAYDYRRAALDALHFAALVDRFWQNLRRAVGFKVQYFACVEPQRRLAGHLHAAIRGAIPRELLRRVVAATYHQVWTPPVDEPVHTDRLPEWDDTKGGYVDPDTGVLLPTWDQALDAIDTDPDASPAHVVKLGRQLDMQGLIGGTPQTDHAVAYLTKYLTKSIAGQADDEPISPARKAHIERLHHEVQWLPCSPRCANWLRHGVQPHHARPGLEPGRCRSKAHRRDFLGLGGRRVLVSRRWTGKTLTDHRADRAAVVRAALETAGIDMDDHTTYSATAARPDGKPRYHWTALRPGDPDGPSYLRVIAHAIAQRREWRHQYEHAKTMTGLSPPNLSATQPAVPAA